MGFFQFLILPSSKKFIRLLSSIILFSEILCKPLIVITDNVIIRLMWSNCPRLSKSQITNKQAICINRQLLIVIIRLMLSLSLCPKMITLRGFHCIYLRTFFANKLEKNPLIICISQRSTKSTLPWLQDKIAYKSTRLECS